MRQFGQIQTAFWTNADIYNLSPAAKLLATYLLTSPHHNCIGCYRLLLPYISADLNTDNQTVTKGFSELSQEGFATYDKGVGWVFMPNYLKWNPIANINMGKALRTELASVPPKSLFYADLIDAIRKYGKHLPNDWETVVKPFANGFEKVAKQG